MNNPKIWLSSPHMGGTEQKYIQEAFDTNWVAPLGPNVNGFEQDLEHYLVNNTHVCTAPKKLDTIWGYFYGKKSQV